MEEIVYRRNGNPADEKSADAALDVELAARRGASYKTYLHRIGNYKKNRSCLPELRREFEAVRERLQETARPEPFVLKLIPRKKGL